MPAAPAEPALSIVGTDVQIAWAAPLNTGGSGIAITQYRVELKLRDGVTFKEDTVTCTGTGIVAPASCVIPMATLTAAGGAFAFTQGDEITARVAAANLAGFGSAGPVATANTVLAEVVPHKPASAPTRGLLSSETQIVVDWVALASPANGGSAITSYNLEWDQGSGTWATLTGIAIPHVSTTYTHTAGLLAGSTYRFRYRASNKYGWGPFSDPVSILAASKPDTPLAPTTTVTDIYVKIAWILPADHSAAVQEYEVLIQQGLGSTAFTA